MHECLIKEDIGSEHFTIGLRLPNSPTSATGSKDNKKYVLPLEDLTIKSSPVSQTDSDWLQSNDSWAWAIGKQQDPVQQMIMFTKMLQLSKERALSLAEKVFDETHMQIGTPSKRAQRPEISIPSRRMYTLGFFFLTLDITSPCRESLRIVLSRLRWKDNVKSSGVRLERARLNWRGKKPEWALTLKIQGQSGGTVTVVKSVF